MTSSEILTYCLLSCTVQEHKEIDDADARGLRNFFTVRMSRGGDRIYFMYHTECEDVTFIKGHITKHDTELGSQIVKVHGFKHLMKELA